MFLGESLGGTASGGRATSTAARRARRPGTEGAGPHRPRARTVALGAVATAGIGVLALGAFAWTMPENVAHPGQVQVRQQLALSYDAETTASAAYPTGKLATPDPVFLRLIPAIDLHLGYRAGAARADSGTESHSTGPAFVGPDGRTGLAGTRRVTAELRSSNGWHRGFELLPRTAFADGGFDAGTRLDLDHVQALIKGVQKETGVKGGTYTVSIRSEIALTGQIVSGTDKTPVRESFFPELTFRYDGKQLALAGETGDDAGAAQVTRVQDVSVKIPGTAANHLRILGRDLPIRGLRTAGLLAALALLLGAGLALRARRAARRNPPSRIVRRIVLEDGAPPVPVGPSPGASAGPPTTISTRVPGPRTTERTRTHPASRIRD